MAELSGHSLHSKCWATRKSFVVFVVHEKMGQEQFELVGTKCTMKIIILFTRDIGIPGKNLIGSLCILIMIFQEFFKDI